MIRRVFGALFLLLAYWLLSAELKGRSQMPDFLTPQRLAAACMVLVVSHAGVALWARKGVAAKVETRIVTKYLQADAKETVRRETVLEKVQVRSQADIKKIDQLATKLAVAQQESTRASQANDADVCLNRAAVLRLASVR